MTAKPLISVIVPAFNAAAFLGEALESLPVPAAYADLEILIVDDGSTDETARIAAAFAAEDGRARVLTQANAGLAAARNRAMTEAKGTFFLFLDADDVLAPGAVAALLDRLETDQKLALTFPRAIHVDEDGTPTGPETSAETRAVSARRLLLDNPIHTDSGVLVRRTALEAAGPFDERLRGFIGLDQWVRVATANAGDIAMAQAATIQYRQHTAQITGSWKRMERNWRALREKLSHNPAISPSLLRAADARQALYFATIAYKAKEDPAARRLILKAWRKSPSSMAIHRHAWVRSAACALSLVRSRR